MKRRAATANRSHSNSHQDVARCRRFRPRFEPLEDRRMLSIGATLADYTSILAETTPDSPIVVSTLLDENDGDYSTGDLSLREALVLAADEASRPGADEITFDATLFTGGPATITLDASLGQLEIDSDVDIKSPGAGQLAIDAASKSRVLWISSDVIASINGLTISAGFVGSGDVGGGVYNLGSLAITKVNIHGNGTRQDGGGVYNAGTLTIADSILSDNHSSDKGAGIFNTGVLTIEDSVLSSNRSYSYGGGVYNTGSAMISNSAISQNRARFGGGGFRNTGSLTITDTTISDNLATSAGAVGAGGDNSGDVVIVGSTFSGNQANSSGGGIYNFHLARVTNTVFVGNHAVEGGGGAIYTFSSSDTVVTNSLFSGNVVEKESGGAICANGKIEIRNSTLAGNSAASHGGGIVARDAVTITNSIVTLNAASEEPDIDGRLTAGSGFNLVSVDPHFVRNPSDGGDGWLDDASTPDIDERSNNDYGDLRLSTVSPAINLVS